MWLVTEDGFFNIIQYPEDKKKDLLTIKARRREDLVAVNSAIYYTEKPSHRIEESIEADYRFRMKVSRDRVAKYISNLVSQIDYPKTKDALNASHPDRAGIYLAVWDTLTELQDK